MSAATQTPAVPPRPSRSQDKDAAPQIPPRPSKKFDRSVSPNPNRFAPSPFNGAPFSSKPPTSSSHLGVNDVDGGPLERSTSVEMPSVGEEGREYAGIADEEDNAELSRQRSISPEHTRTVGADVKLHAPKPSLPASSAKERVKAVTRTDSDKAASFGIGRPREEDASHPASNRSLRKKASTISQLSNTDNLDDEHGIPEIGRQVPMYPNAGDVQAPSPAPGANNFGSPAEGGRTSRNHHRKASSRGNLPPGSYGLHGHGVAPQDKLEKAYFDKHPDLLKKEHAPYQSDRPRDYSMSSEHLNKIVRDTASRGSGATREFTGTPSEQVGWQAIDETTSRVNSPHLTSENPVADRLGSPLKQRFNMHVSNTDKGDVIHIDEPNRRRSMVASGDESSGLEQDEENGYRAPILADDEVGKDPNAYDHAPAVEPGPERSGSAFEMERPKSGPAGRPASLYREHSYDLDHQSTPLEDVQEYEPLFPEDDKSTAPIKDKTHVPAHSSTPHSFPSQDVWEDAPNSVHYTAEVSTPEPVAASQSSAAPRDGETAAQAFARHQEELAEKEARENRVNGLNSARNSAQPKPNWAQHQPHLASDVKKPNRPGSRGFPSQDVWEDTPDSLQLEATVSTPQQEEDKVDQEEGVKAAPKPDVPQRPTKKSSESSLNSVSTEKPSVPDRPRKQTSTEDVSASSSPSVKSPPTIPDRRPKPQIPARPVKAGPTSGGLEPAEAAAPPKQKPAVPVRPTGSKISALQAGFMSDLNNRLRLGPQAPRKEEVVAEESLAEEKEKVPLSDARKGRARGPQRRAPAKSMSPAPGVEAKPQTVQFGFASVCSYFSIDPTDDVLQVGDLKKERADLPSKVEGIKEEEVEVEEKKDVGDVGTNVPKSEEVSPKAEGLKTEADQVKPAAEEIKAKAEDPKAETEKTKTLATNMAGEPVIEETITKDSDAVKVEAEEL